jgi:hypothetical protein
MLFPIVEYPAIINCDEYRERMNRVLKLHGMTQNHHPKFHPSDALKHL